MIKLGNVELNKGEKAEGFLPIGLDTDGTQFKLPLLVAKGMEEGPTLWVQGCIHGDEYGGAASIINFYKEIDITNLKGTLICLPVVNLPSFKARSRISPMDGANLNRIFPGNPSGTYSQRLAYKLQEEIIKHADYMLDLHSGGIALYVDYFMITKNADSEVAKKSRWLAERMGAHIIWDVAPDNVTSGTVTDHVQSAGIPTVTVEVGGGEFTKLHEEQYKNSISGAMKALEMLPGTPQTFDTYEVYTQADFIFAPEGGLFVPACEVGTKLQKGELIGTIINLLGEVNAEVRCKHDNSYLAASMHRYWPTEPGRLLAETYH